MPLPDHNAPTIDNLNTSDFKARGKVAVGNSHSSAAASLAFRESTRLLLRERLIVAAYSLLCIAAVFTVITMVIANVGWFEIVVRLVGAVAIVAILAYLKGHAAVGLPRLRIFELVLLSIPVIEILTILVHQTEFLVAEGKLTEVTILRSVVSLAICMVITLYGMFIPGTWRRTAVITGVVACLPMATAMIQTEFNPLLQSAEAIRVDVALPVFLLTAAIAAIASVGAHVVHRIRREIETARQYGQYQLGEEIGAGGMGAVYKAEHRMLKRPAAIKLIHAAAAFDEESIKKFEQEVQISATLSHWNTVQIYDYGRTKDGEFFYVMEYLEGKTLHQHIQRLGILTPTETITFAKQICDGLEEAHAINMVHRDLKPANVFLADIGGQSEVVKILDFGLAIHATAGKERNTIAGTPRYMSPEQIRGGALDGRSDIYAIGCMLFECVTGSPPFLDLTIAGLLDQHLKATPPLDSIPEESQSLSPIIERCLKKDPADRFDDVVQLRAALDVIKV